MKNKIKFETKRVPKLEIKKYFFLSIVKIQTKKFVDFCEKNNFFFWGVCVELWKKNGYCFEFWSEYIFETSKKQKVYNKIENYRTTLFLKKFKFNFKLLFLKELNFILNFF